MTVGKTATKFFDGAAEEVAIASGVHAVDFASSVCQGRTPASSGRADAVITGTAGTVPSNAHSNPFATGLAPGFVVREVEHA